MERPSTPDSRTENLTTVHTLRNYLAQGFLLHGSKKLLTAIEPRQATDADPNRTTGKAHAIYAEAHDVRIPIVMALFDKMDPTLDGFSSSYHGHGPQTTLTIGGSNCTLTEGYVYVLPPDSFLREGTDDDNEFISTQPVVPVAIIKINPSIIDVLDNIQNNLNQ